MDNTINIQILVDEIWIIHHSGIQRLKYDEIVCITSDRPYVCITSKTGNKYFTTRLSIKKGMKCLPECFCLCNQSAIINMKNVTGYQKKGEKIWVQLESNINIEVSRRCRPGLKKKLMTYTELLSE